MKTHWIQDHFQHYCFVYQSTIPYFYVKVRNLYKQVTSNKQKKTSVSGLEQHWALTQELTLLTQHAHYLLCIMYFQRSFKVAVTWPLEPDQGKLCFLTNFFCLSEKLRCWARTSADMNFWSTDYTRWPSRKRETVLVKQEQWFHSMLPEKWIWSLAY